MKEKKARKKKKKKERVSERKIKKHMFQSQAEQRTKKKSLTEK